MRDGGRLVRKAHVPSWTSAGLGWDRARPRRWLSHGPGSARLPYGCGPGCRCRSRGGRRSLLVWCRTCPSRRDRIQAAASRSPGGCTHRDRRRNRTTNLPADTPRTASRRKLIESARVDIQTCWQPIGSNQPIIYIMSTTSGICSTSMDFTLLPYMMTLSERS